MLTFHHCPVSSFLCVSVTHRELRIHIYVFSESPERKPHAHTDIIPCVFPRTKGFSDFTGGTDDKNLTAMEKTQVQFLGREDPLEEGMETHSTVLAWRIPWTEELGGPQFMGVAKSRTRLSDYTFTFKGIPRCCSLLL